MKSEEIKELLKSEAQAILNIPVTDNFEKAINLIVEQVNKKGGKLVTSGMGKAGQIAMNIATTFCSTGTPAIFLHPSEAQHGDLGVVQRRTDTSMNIKYRTEPRKVNNIATNRKEVVKPQEAKPEKIIDTNKTSNVTENKTEDTKVAAAESNKEEKKIKKLVIARRILCFGLPSLVLITGNVAYCKIMDWNPFKLNTKYKEKYSYVQTIVDEEGNTSESIIDQESEDILTFHSDWYRDENDNYVSKNYVFKENELTIGEVNNLNFIDNLTINVCQIIRMK